LATAKARSRARPPHGPLRVALTGTIGSDLAKEILRANLLNIAVGHKLQAFG